MGRHRRFVRRRGTIKTSAGRRNQISRGTTTSPAAGVLRGAVIGFDYAINSYNSHQLRTTVLRAGGTYGFELTDNFIVAPQLELGLPAIHPSWQAEDDNVASDSDNLEQLVLIPSVRLVAHGSKYGGFLQAGGYALENRRYGPKGGFITVGGTVLIGK